VISIIIPTYNERNNICRVIRKLSKALKGYEHEIIVVDDNSPDGTAEKAREMAKKYPVRVFQRKKRLGLATAIVYGFRKARGEILGVIDADMQHTPELARELVEAVRTNHDLAIASRYVEGGKIVDWPFYRKIISKAAIYIARPFTDLKDPVSGYFFLKKSVIDGVRLEAIGYKILLEILVKGKYGSVVEIPYTFQGRTEGRSKLGLGTLFDYMRLIFMLYLYKMGLAC